MYSATSSVAVPATSSSSSSSSSLSAASGSRRSYPVPSPSAAPAPSSASSSSLFNFSSHPAYAAPSDLLASELEGPVYRGVDHSSALFALPADHSLAMSASALSLADFDAAASLDSSHASDKPSSAFSPHAPASARQLPPKKLDIPSFATLTDLSASDFPSFAPSDLLSSPLPSFASAATATFSASLPAPVPSPVRVSNEPSYLERYTSFYSATPADQLLASLTATLTSHHIDHTLSLGKAKLVVSFQCPFLSSLTVTFILRLYRAASRPGTLIVEGQRREGCVVAFHHVWERLVKECKAQGLCTGLVEEAQKEAIDSSSSSSSEASMAAGVLGMCSLLGNRAAAASSTQGSAAASSPSASTSSSSTPGLPSFQLDASASAILSNLVDHGDILQQRDALRLLSLSLLSSPSASTQCQSFLERIARWAAPPSAAPATSASSATATASSSSACLDDERTAQLARLMLVCSQKGSTASFVRQCAQSLFDLLDELVRAPSSAMSMCRLRGLRCLLQVVGQLCRAEGGRVLVPYVGSHERAVLERCAGMPDETIQQESRAVLQRLGQVC